MSDLLFTFWVASANNLQPEYAGMDEKKKMLMSEDVAKHSIDFMIKKMKGSKVNSARVMFCGDEPTRNLEIVKYIVQKIHKQHRQYDIRFGMTTSGYWVDNRDFQFLVDNIEDLVITMEGDSTCWTNEFNCAGDRYAYMVFANARMINQFRPIILKLPINTCNYGKLYESVSFLIEQGFASIIPEIDYNDDNWQDEHFEELQFQFEKIKMYLEMTGCNAYVAGLDGDELGGRGLCDGCESNFYIGTDGTLYPCKYVVDNKECAMGDVKHDVEFDRYREHIKICIGEISECQGCTFYQYCPSVRCKYINKKLMGDYYKASPIVCATQRMLLQVCEVIEND